MSSPRFITSAIGTLVLLAAGRTAADELVWVSPNPGALFDTASNWNLNNPPDDFDNVTFNLNAAQTVNIGAPSNANNFTVTDGDWTFTGGNGTSLDTEGVVTVDDPFAGSLAAGAAATLAGPSNWFNAGVAVVGDAGFGTLTVNGGADFNANQIFVGGNQSSGVGVATVTGAGSVLNATRNFNTSLHRIGFAGGTGTINVLSGGQLRTASTTTGDISIGEGAGSMGTLNVDGGGSLAESEDVWVGLGGTGFLNITGGGQILQTDSSATATPNNDMQVALSDANSVGEGTVLISGDNSLWSFRRGDIGTTGIGIATIEAGGRMAASENLTLGTTAGSDGSLTVSGAGGMADSSLGVGDVLTVGALGKGTLTVEAAGDVTAQSIFIGSSSTADNQVAVTGAGSTVTLSGFLQVGQGGIGSMDIMDSADVGAARLIVGGIAGSSGELRINGAGSSLSLSSNAAIGTRGDGSLEVSGGASLTNADEFWVGFDAAGDGDVLVTGPGSVLTANLNDITYIGGHMTTNGGTGRVDVEDGGQLVSLRHIYIGGNAAGEGSLTVTGPASHLDADDGGANEFTYVGYANRGTFFVDAGASADSENVHIGELATAGVGEASATVRGVGSTWNISGQLIVGNAGVGRLNIISGGILNVATVTNADLIIGNAATSNNNLVFVSGADSHLNHLGTGRISVGTAGGSADVPVQLQVIDGGRVSTTRLNVADGAGSVAEVTVGGLGPEARIDATQEITIGDQGNGTATINAFGVMASQGVVRIGGIQSGVGKATVSGVNAQLTAATTLSVADASTGPGAATGTLAIDRGGHASSGGHAFIGRQGQNVGVVSVGGDVHFPISTFNVGDSLFVGGSDAAAGGTGTFTVHNGATATIENELKIWPGGDVSMEGDGVLSTLSVETLTRAGGGFFFNGGRLLFQNNAANNRLLDSAALADIFNADPTIVPGQVLEIAGPVTLSAPLRLNGGALAVASVKPGSEADFRANLDWDAGELHLTGQGLNVAAGGPLGDNVSATPGMTLAVSGGGLANDGALNVIGATAAFTGGASTNNPGAEINAINAMLTFTGGLTNNGGVNLINSTVNGNLVNGAGSNSSLLGSNSFSDDLVLANGDTLLIDIAGDQPGEFDVITVGGEATLDGLLAVSLTGGFTPTVGQQFTVLTASSIVDNGLVLGGAAASSFDLLVGSTSVILQAITAGLPGDYNQNGIVDAADYSVWRDNLGSGASLPNDDTAGVGQDDYDRWKMHFGQIAGSGSLTNSSVPEPTNLMLLMIAATGLCLSRGRAAQNVPATR